MIENGDRRELPERWEWMKLGDVAEVIRGVTYKKDQSREEPATGHLPLLRSGNVQEQLVIDDGLVFVPATLVRDDQLLRQGDIVVSVSNSKELVGKAASLSESWSGTFGAFLSVVRPNASVVDPRYLAWYFQSPGYRAVIARLSAATNNIANIKKDHLISLNLPLPPLEEQERIVARLDALSNGLAYAGAQLSQVLDHLYRFERAVLYSLTHRALASGRALPDGWQRRTVADAVEIVGVPSKVKKSDYLTTGALAVVDQGEGLINGYTDDASKAVPADPPLVAFGDHTRRIKYCPFPFAQGADGLKVLRARPGIDGEYLYWALRALDVPSRGYGRHFALLRAAVIVLPSVDEQERSSRELAERFDEIKSLRLSVEEARQREVALRAAALTRNVMPLALAEKANRRSE